MVSHPQFHFPSQHPIRWFTLEHPCAPDWAILALVTLGALLLWIWNS